MDTIVDREIKRLEHKVVGLEAFKKYLTNQLFVIEKMRDYSKAHMDYEALTYYTNEKHWYENQLNNIVNRAAACMPLYYFLKDSIRRMNYGSEME